MRKIENKKVNIIINAINEGKQVQLPHTLIYSQLIYQTVNRSPFTTEEIKIVNRINSKIEKLKDEEFLQFEEVDYALLKKKLLTMEWRFSNMDFVEFADYINNVKEE